ncbi:hypothetical protein HDV05_003887 [Chytridiales sp. JEL 0842]|nr:hypothetical protein HDV05_003887 [Chytridiales sp. JEL 0842]
MTDQEDHRRILDIPPSLFETTEDLQQSLTELLNGTTTSTSNAFADLTHLGIHPNDDSASSSYASFTAPSCDTTTEYDKDEQEHEQVEAVGEAEKAFMECLMGQLASSQAGGTAASSPVVEEVPVAVDSSKSCSPFAVPASAPSPIDTCFKLPATTSSGNTTTIESPQSSLLSPPPPTATQQYTPVRIVTPYTSTSTPRPPRPTTATTTTTPHPPCVPTTTTPCTPSTSSTTSSNTTLPKKPDQPKPSSHIPLIRILSPNLPRPFECAHPSCTSAFKSLGHLIRHVRIHTNERPFGCWIPGCELSFTRADTANKHTRSHARRLVMEGRGGEVERWKGEVEGLEWVLEETSPVSSPVGGDTEEGGEEKKKRKNEGEEVEDVKMKKRRRGGGRKMSSAGAVLAVDTSEAVVVKHKKTPPDNFNKPPTPPSSTTTPTPLLEQHHHAPPQPCPTHAFLQPPPSRSKLTTPLPTPLRINTSPALLQHQPPPTPSILSNSPTFMYPLLPSHPIVPSQPFLHPPAHPSFQPMLGSGYPTMGYPMPGGGLYFPPPPPSHSGVVQGRGGGMLMGLHAGGMVVVPSQGHGGGFLGGGVGHEQGLMMGLRVATPTTPTTMMMAGQQVQVQGQDGKEEVVDSDTFIKGLLEVFE